MKFMSIAPPNTLWPPTFPRAVMTASGQTGRALRLRDAVNVRLAVYKIEGVDGNNLGVKLFAVRIVKQLFEAFVAPTRK